MTIAFAAVYEVSGQAPFRHFIGFSARAQAVRGRDRASCRRLLASSALAFFLPRRSPLSRSWGRAAGGRGGRKNAHARWTLPPAARRSRNPSCRLASLTARAGRSDNRLSV